MRSSLRYLGLVIGTIWFTALTSSCIFGDDEDPDVQNQAKLCQEYCDLALSTCTGERQLFAAVNTCKSSCNTYPITGKDGDTKGDSVQCRIYHLTAAKSDPVTHCPHAAPDGGGICTDDLPPTPCQQYCGQIQESCNEEITKQYNDQTDCLAKCPLFRDNGTLGDDTGNTTQCRLTQIVQPDPNMSKVQRCNNAGVNSTTCVDN